MWIFSTYLSENETFAFLHLFNTLIATSPQLIRVSEKLFISSVFQLNELSEDECREKIAEGKQDAVCYLYDVTDPASFRYVADLQQVSFYWYQ